MAAKKQPAAASAEENRLTLEDVAWAGGDDEDLDLIAGIDDSSDDEAIHGGGDQEEVHTSRSATITAHRPMTSALLWPLSLPAWGLGPVTTRVVCAF